MVKVAVASKDGISVNLHFGHARSFLIYEMEQGSCRFIESRDVDLYCLGNSSSQSAMEKILETIKDCQACFVAKIGSGPAEKLQNIGVRSVADYAYESVDEALNSYSDQIFGGG